MFTEDILKNDVIVVTGGGTGLGKSMARRFAELKAKVVISGRRKEILDAAVEEISADTGGDIVSIPCDIREFAEVEQLADDVVKRFGKITGLVNNAAGNFLCRTENLSPNGFRSIVEIVLHGSFHATLACGRKMIEQGQGGKILSILTTYAWNGSAFVVPSACAKAGVLAMTKSLAVEWSAYNIRVNAVAPGPFPTPGAWEKLMPPGVEELARERVPLKRFGEHIELANLATYLLSDYSGYVTGECITIDGGEQFMGGEFSHLMMIPRESLDQTLKDMRLKTHK